MSTTTKEIPAWKVRQELAEQLSLREVSKWIKREYIARVEGIYLQSGQDVQIIKFTIYPEKENQKIYELTNDRGLGRVLERAFFKLWRAKEEEIKTALELADYAQEMAEDYKTKGASNKSSFIHSATLIKESQQKQNEIWAEIETALYVANN